MNAQQIRDYIRAAVEDGQSMFTIVQTLARVAGINAQSAAQHVNDEMQNMGTPLSVEASRGLFKQALDLDTKTSYQVAGPGLPGSLNYGNLPLSPGLGGEGITAGLPIAADLPISAADAFAGQTAVPEPATQAQQWASFMAGRPGLPEALRGGASRLYPQIQTQFGLQPSVSGPIQSFRDFLSGGQFLTGEDLRNRLGSVAGAVRAPFGSFSPIVPGTEEENPYGAMMSALQTSFQEPAQAFSAFTQPYLQRAGAGRGRRILESAFDRWQQGWMGRNPAATSGDVAALFGR
jgi:hypothetical protein